MSDPSMSEITARHIRVRWHALRMMQEFLHNPNIYFGDVKPEQAEMWIALAEVLEPAL